MIKKRVNIIEHYAHLTDDAKRILDEADHAAAASDIRHTHEEVFSRLKDGLHV